MRFGLDLGLERIADAAPEGVSIESRDVFGEFFEFAVVEDGGEIFAELGTIPTKRKMHTDISRLSFLKLAVHKWTHQHLAFFAVHSLNSSKAYLY